MKKILFGIIALSMLFTQPSLAAPQPITVGSTVIHAHGTGNLQDAVGKCDPASPSFNSCVAAYDPERSYRFDQSGKIVYGGGSPTKSDCVMYQVFDPATNTIMGTSCVPVTNLRSSYVR